MTSLRTRILFFFTLFAAIALLAVYVSGRSMRVIGAAANGIVRVHLPMVQALGEMSLALERQDNSLYRYLITDNKIWMDECEKERVSFSDWFTKAKGFSTETIEFDHLLEIDENYFQYDNLMRQSLLNARKNPSRTKKLLDEQDQYLGKIHILINQIKEFRHGMTVVRQEQVAATMRRHNRLGYLFLISILFFFVALGFYLWRFLMQPLSLLINGIRNFTRGKSEVQIPSIGKDELGELQEAFNEMSRELDQERKRLRNESQSDSLTGLFNMRYFRMQLSEEFSRSQRYGRPLTLLMVDVDNFKKYNDQNGHPAGDIVLKEVSRILFRNVRGTDIVGRYGGEEFVVLLPETPLDSGVNVAEKVRKAVEGHYFPFAGAKDSSGLTVSIGVASYPNVDVTSDQELIDATDKALYAAKHAGRNAVFVSSLPEGNISYASYTTAKKPNSQKN